MADESEPLPRPKPKPKSEAEQAGILVWGKITAKAAEALTPLLVVRLLGQADVGVFATLLFVYQTIATLLTAGFPRAVLYFLADQDLGSRRALMRRMSLIMLGLGVLTGLSLVAIGIFGDSVLTPIGEWLAHEIAGTQEGEPGAKATGAVYRFLPILGLYAVADIPVRLLPNMLISEGRPRASAGVGVLQSLGATIGTLVPAAIGYGVGGIAVGMTFFALGMGGVYLAYLRAVYREAPKTPAGVSTKNMFAYAIPLGLTDIVSMLNRNLDLALIIVLFSLDRVAVYKTGAWQIPVVTTIAYSLGSVYLPRFAKMFREGQNREAMQIWRHSIEKVSLIVVPLSLVFIVSAEEFVTVAFTADYSEAAGVFRAYCFLVLLRVSAFGSLMLAAGKPGYVLRAALFTVVSNLLISVPMVLWLGFYGPAIGTAIAFIPTLIYYNLYIAKAAKVKFSETFPLLAYLKILAVALIPAAAAVAIKMVLSLHPAIMFGLEAVTVLGGWAAAGTLAGLITREDWNFALDWVRLRVLK